MRWLSWTSKVASLTLMVLTLGARPALAGRLDEVRSETQDSSGSDDDDDDDDGSSSGIVFFDSDDGTSTSNDSSSSGYVLQRRRRYARYPFEGGSAGYVHIIEADDAPDGDLFAGSVTLDGAYLGTTLGRAGFDAHLMLQRVGVGVDFAPYIEREPADALILGSAQGVVALVLRPRWQVYAGAGVGFMVDARVLPAEERVDAWGVNATIRSAFLPFEPYIIRGRFDIGRLGVATTMMGRCTIGGVVQRWEFFGGYEVRSVGEVLMHGPTAGVRVWF